MARAISAAAPSPWTRVGLMTISDGARRVRRTRTMSRTAAPSSEVTMPMRVGSIGNGRLRAGAKSPSACRRRRSCSYASCSAPAPRGSMLSAYNWYLPLGTYTDRRPFTTTCSPVVSLKRRRIASVRQSTAERRAP